MTAWKSRWKMGKYYEYYWCQNPECLDSEIISAHRIHQDTESIFAKYTLNSNITNLAKDIITQIYEEENKLDSSIKQSRIERLKTIKKQMKEIEDNLCKTSLPALIKKQEETWLLLDTERAKIEEESTSETLKRDKNCY